MGVGWAGTGGTEGGGSGPGDPLTSNLVLPPEPQDGVVVSSLRELETLGHDSKSLEDRHLEMAG